MKTKNYLRNAVLLAALTAAMLVCNVMPAMAAGWQKNDTGWWYGTNADNSTWYANEWQWIDGDGNGIAECYCFDANGYMYENTTTPDGYTVNADGAWTENGVVQTKAVAGTPNVSTGTQTVDTGSTDNTSDGAGTSSNSNGLSNLVLGAGDSSGGTGSSSSSSGGSGLRKLSDEEAYQCILEVMEEHPEGSGDGNSCFYMVTLVNGKMYGNPNIYLPFKGYLDWDDLHVGDAIVFTTQYGTIHYIVVMEVHDDYVVAAESGYATRNIRYGRHYSRAEIEAGSPDVLSAWNY